MVNQKQNNNLDIQTLEEIKEDKEKYSDIHSSIYSDSVPLERLPKDLVERTIKLAKRMDYRDEVDLFYYKDHVFELKNEGYGMFSLFDPDLLFYEYTHLFLSLL